MTPIKTGLALTLMTACLATTAEAGLGGAFGGYSQDMEYVADLAFPATGADGRSFALCHLIGENTMFHIPYAYESKGYVLAENRCETDDYQPLTPEAFAEAQAAGRIPAAVPAQPSLSPLQQLTPVLVGLLAGMAILWALRSKLRARARSTGMGGLPRHAQRVLDVACHAAKAGGTIGDQKINMIAEILHKTTDIKVDTGKIRKVAANCESSLQQQDFARFSHGLAKAQKELLMKVALIVVGSDGKLGKAEQKFLDGLATGLSISQSRFQNLMLEMG